MDHLLSLLRRTSVVKRLLYLFLIQSIVVALFCVSAIHNSVQGVADSMRLSGQQLLNAASSQMDAAIAEIKVLTKYPVLQDAFGRTLTFEFLTRSSSDTSRRLTYYRDIQSELLNLMMLHPGVSLVGIGELSGTLIYCDTGNIYYHLSRFDLQSALFQSILDEKGGCVIIPSPQIAQVTENLPQPEVCLFGARAIMKLNHLTAVGVALCCIDLTSMRESFELGRLYEAQRLCILDSGGNLLYGQAAPFVPAQLSAPPAGAFGTRILHDGEGLAVYQLYHTKSGLLSILRTPVSCIARDLSAQLISMGVLLLLFVISVLVFSRLLVRSIREPIDKLMDVCERIREEDFSPVEEENAHDEMHSLIESFNAMSAHIQRLIKEVYEKNLLQAQTEMQLLRSQINPHFVYNTLDTIRAAALAQGSGDLADMTALLGKILRYGVTRQSEPVTVEQDLSNLRDYIALQQMHFHGRLTVLVNVEPELLGCYIIKLVLQPLVENAIYHGIAATEDEGCIRVLGYAEADDIVFTVADNGVGIAPDELKCLRGYIDGKNDAFASIGLRNTNRRIHLYYGRRYGLDIRSILGQGTVITVRVPRKLTPFSGFEKEERI